MGQVYRREVNYDLEAQREISERCNWSMTSDQQSVFITFIQAVQNKQKGMFFFHASGGCGKTFLIQTILSTIRSERKTAIDTASSGLAATLLTSGKTVHSTFKVPLDITRTEQPFCSIKKGTALSRLIQDCHAIVVDEATMFNKAVFEALVRTLKDIRSTYGSWVEFQLCCVEILGKYFL